MFTLIGLKKYLTLKWSIFTSSTYFMFHPLEVETERTRGPSAHSIFKDISKQLVDASRDPRGGFYLGQRLSFAIQRAT